MWEQLRAATGNEPAVIITGINVFTHGRAVHACVNISFNGEEPFLNETETAKLRALAKFRTAFLN